MQNSIINQKCSIAAHLQMLLVLLMLALASCNGDENLSPDLATASIESLEIGSGNNGKGIIGMDFHFDMDVVAATKIEHIQIAIKQQAGKTYLKQWSFELIWEEFKGAKNTNVHKHFDIPKDAPEGFYDFIIRITDENGSVKEDKHEIELIGADKLPVMPALYSLMLEKPGTGFVYIFNRGYTDPNDKGYSKGDTLKSYVDIRGVKDDGVIYTLLIKKSAGHLPETVNDIDFSKVIVADVRQHKDIKEVGTFTNYVGLPNYSPRSLEVGSTADNNTPTAGAIDKGKSWESGDYYFGVVYTNTTHNMSAHYYINLKLAGF